MAPTASFTSALGLMALGARTVAADCLSFGMDFQNGGSYFQNSLSNDDFTFVSQFEGCQSDSSYNILVNSTGDQVACTDTPLTPDDTNQLSTCSIEKSQLTSGNYSIVLYSNNGNGDPFNGQRDFYLSVGPQSTSTYTPTATATIVVTPVVNVTSTTTSTTTTTLPPSTVTNPSVTITPTTTVTPQKVTTTSTKALLTLKYTAYSVAISKVTQTKTASCHYPTRAARHDPPARIKPTVGPAARLVSAKYRREVFEEEKRRFVEERAARMALVERAPDPQPLVVTDTNTAHWPTVTSTSSAPATTATLTTEATATATITPVPVVVISGKATAAKVTVTAATPTKTVTRYTIATSVTTKTINYAYTIMSTTTPAAVKSACKTAGGIVF